MRARFFCFLARVFRALKLLVSLLVSFSVRLLSKILYIDARAQIICN